MNLRVTCVHSILLLAIFAGGRDAYSFTEQEVRSAAVELRATISDSVPRITLEWNASPYPVSSQILFRRRQGTQTWDLTISLDPGTQAWADSTAAGGTLYEYRIERRHESPFGSLAEGWIWAGSGIPAVEDRGRLILAIDSSIAETLAGEIHRLIGDFTGDGWEVYRTDIARSATPQQARDAIRGWYAVDPGRTRAVLLLGRIPVPYSGMVCPDGHWDPPPLAHHRGAWPADAYYGDMDGVWTDSSINYSMANVDGSRNHNVPGDGKFDVSLLAGDHLPEIAVGRVDFANLSGYSSGLSETELLRRYLDRLHAFRHREGAFTSLGDRALVDDDTFGPQWGLATSVSGWTSGVALFGAGGATAGDWIPGLRDQDYLVAYGCGPGSFTSAGGVSSVSDFRDTRCRAVFNLLFGSFFGDWDSNDNFLRAPLVGRSDSRGLISVWSGVPGWRLFPLAAGGTMVDAYQHVVREVNQPGGPFPPADESWTNPDQSHVALMGDPTLRSHPPFPVTSLSASLSGSEVALSWVNPSTESNRLGCRVYRAERIFGPYQRVGAQTSAGATGFADTPLHPGRWYYLVRSVKRQATASATYDNLAQGVLAEIDVPEVGYLEWTAGLGNSSETADPNGDGIPNLLAFSLGASSGNVSALALVPRQDSSGFLVPFSGIGEVAYEVQRSLDLKTWYAVARKPAGDIWALNPGSGYLHQNQISVSAYGAAALRFDDPGAGISGYWRLRVSR